MNSLVSQFRIAIYRLPNCGADLDWTNRSIMLTLTLSVIRETCIYFQACKGGSVSESSVSLLEVSTTESPFRLEMKPR